MNLDAQLESKIAEAFQNLFQADLPVEDISLQPTRKDFEGTHTFVTFSYLKITKKKPEETGQMLGDYLLQHTDLVKSFNVVKGFLNLTLKDTAWFKVFEKLVQDPGLGIKKAGKQKIVIEYSSPNTNKPLHLGHLRNNFLGYATACILEAYGHKVEKVNLVNDRGIHICKSMLAYQRFGNNETPESSGIKGDHLIGKYYVIFDQEYKKEIGQLVSEGMDEEEAKKQAPLMKAAQEMLTQWEKGDKATVELWQTMNDWVYEGFDATYQRMGVDFDKIYHESDTYLLGKDIVDEGLEKGLFYKKDNGAVWANLENEGLDEKLLLRADGTSVYMTQDLGTADLKFKDFGFDQSIYVVGNEQDYHFKVLFTLLKKLGRPYSDGMFHLSYGMVDLPSGKMKSREGTVVDADDLMDEMTETARKQTQELGKIEGFTEKQAEDLYQMIGLGALKYFLLKVDPKKRMLFNPEESVQFQGDTGPFIQYTHARISAILRKAAQLGIPENANTLGQLHPEEIDVIYWLNQFGNKVEEAAKEFAPSVIAQYVIDVAKSYNRFYTVHSIFGEDSEAVKSFRVNLSRQVGKTIAKGMGLLGIQVPEKM